MYTVQVYSASIRCKYTVQVYGASVPEVILWLLTWIFRYIFIQTQVYHKSLCLPPICVIISILSNKLYELSWSAYVCINYSQVNCWLIDHKSVSTKFSYLVLTIGCFTHGTMFPENSVVAQLANKYQFYGKVG